MASEETQHADGIGIRGIFRGFKADLDVALGRQIVDLVGLRLLQQPNDIRRVRQIAIMQKERRLLFVGFLI